MRRAYMADEVLVLRAVDVDGMSKRYGAMAARLHDDAR